MTTLGLLLLFAGSVGGAGIHDALTKGLCLCVADNDIYARDGRKLFTSNVVEFFS